MGRRRLRGGGEGNARSHRPIVMMRHLSQLTNVRRYVTRPVVRRCPSSKTGVTREARALRRGGVKRKGRGAALVRARRLWDRSTAQGQGVDESVVRPEVYPTVRDSRARGDQAIGAVCVDERTLRRGRVEIAFPAAEKNQVSDHRGRGEERTYGQSGARVRGQIPPKVDRSIGVLANVEECAGEYRDENVVALFNRPQASGTGTVSTRRMDEEPASRAQDLRPARGCLDRR